MALKSFKQGSNRFRFAIGVRRGQDKRRGDSWEAATSVRMSRDGDLDLCKSRGGGGENTEQENVKEGESIVSGD